MADDLDLADFGHLAEIFSFGRPEKLRSVDVWNIKWG